MLKICPECGSEFETKLATKKFCQQSCGKLFHVKKYWEKKREESTNFCIQCGKKIIKDKSRFCSRPCKIKWHKKREKHEPVQRQDGTIFVNAPPENAVWVRTGNIYPGFNLSPEQAERLKAVISIRNEYGNNPIEKPV